MTRGYRDFDVTVSVHGAFRLKVRARTADEAKAKANRRYEGKEVTDEPDLFLVGLEAVEIEETP